MSFSFWNTLILQALFIIKTGCISLAIRAFYCVMGTHLGTLKLYCAFFLTLLREVDQVSQAGHTEA